MGLGKEAQDFDERPDVPANSAGPDDRRDASFGIRPDGGLAFVVAVEEQVCFRVEGDGGDFVPLQDDVVCERERGVS